MFVKQPSIERIERLIDDYGSKNLRMVPGGIFVMGNPGRESTVSFSFESKSRAGGSITGHNETKDGSPAGGWAMDGYYDHSQDSTPHFCIRWQDGPVDRAAHERRNGAFVEDVLAVLIERVEFYQRSRFACPENAAALGHLKAGLEQLESRRNDREERGVQGKHEA